MNLHLVTAWKVYLIGNGVRATEFIGVTASLSKKRACIKSVNAAPDAHKNISQIVSTLVKGIDTVDFNVEQHEAKRNFFLSTHFYEGKFFMGALIFTWNELTSLTFLGSLAMQPLTFSFSLSIPFFLALSLSPLSFIWFIRLCSLFSASFHFIGVQSDSKLSSKALNSGSVFIRMSGIGSAASTQFSAIKKQQLQQQKSLFLRSLFWWIDYEFWLASHRQIQWNIIAFD